MTRFRRLAVLLVPLALGLGSFVLPGRAQQATSSRFAFADTTLLRDTLGLDFSRLFPAADSLRLVPDTLRAWMIRYRMNIPRMIQIADSLHYPVDSVGPVLERERTNPLAALGAGARSMAFRYTSKYDIQQTSNDWTNSSDYQLTRGPLYLTNNTSILMQRFTTGGRLTLRQQRSANTEAGWRLGQKFSVGGRASLLRYLSSGAIGTNETETTNKFDLTMRSRQAPNPAFNSELNFLSGLQDFKGARQTRHGLNADLNGRARYAGSWLTNEVSGQITGSLSRARARGQASDVSTKDLSNNLAGTLGIYQDAPVGLLVAYQLRRSSVQNPEEGNTVNTIITRNNSIDGTLQGRIDNDRYLTARGSLGNTLQSTGNSDSRTAEGTIRWLLLGWGIDGHLRETHGFANYPRRAELNGYDETSTNRAVDGTGSRQFGPRVSMKVNGSVTLDRYRYRATADSVQLPVDRDSYRQLYRIEVLFNQSERMNSTVGTEVSLTSLVNIPGRATSSNNDLRSYRADWRWSYRLMRGLTANQTNSVTAEYRIYPFAGERNDLSLDYNSNTILSAVVTPRFSVNLSHNLREQPRGTYLPQADGRVYLLPSDEGRNYTLRANVTYTPMPGLSLSLAPDYQETSRVGNQNGVEVPQRKGKSLNFSSSANLNLQLGRKGTLTGSIARSLQSNRSTTYASGVPQVSPRSQVDFWNGSLTLSWNL